MKMTDEKSIMKLIEALKEIKQICLDKEDCKLCNLAEEFEDTGGYICKFGLIASKLNKVPCELDIERIIRL